jgi:hypothetical protein
MCANIVLGREEPVQDRTVGTLTFKHLLTKLNVFLYAENADAVNQYGKILSVAIAYQPEEIIMDIVSGALQPASSMTRHDVYRTVGFDPAANRLFPHNTAAPDFGSASNFGYVMALPAKKYTVVVNTEERLYFYTDVTLPSTALSSSFKAGKVYNIILRFLDADEIIIEVMDADEWWMDSTFN